MVCSSFGEASANTAHEGFGPQLKHAVGFALLGVGICIPVRGKAWWLRQVGVFLPVDT